jgi:hypothetical protein
VVRVRLCRVCGVCRVCVVVVRWSSSTGISWADLYAPINTELRVKEWVANQSLTSTRVGGCGAGDAVPVLVPLLVRRIVEPAPPQEVPDRRRPQGPQEPQIRTRLQVRTISLFSF